jgi:hypothetical protein
MSGLVVFGNLYTHVVKELRAPAASPLDRLARRAGS